MSINTFGTGSVSDRLLEKTVAELADLRPGAIIEKFNLRRAIYKNTAAYGHFGRTELNLPWESTKLTEDLKSYIKRQ